MHDARTGICTRRDILADQLGLELDCNFPGGMAFPDYADDSFAYGEILRQQMDNFIDAPVEVRATDNVGARLSAARTARRQSVC